MNEAIRRMLAKYDLKTTSAAEHALVEIMQQIVLLGLWRGKFFEQAAFYGGTALRILHGLDRFSEDLDFELRRSDPDFVLDPYLPFVRNELLAFGFEVKIETRKKNVDSAVESAFLKAETLELLIKIGSTHKTQKGKLTQIKFEVDTNPPYLAATEALPVLDPISFNVLTLTPPELFAGKMHAVLCRHWKGRVKGRDWYDMVFYVARGTPLNLAHLKAKMVQSGHIPAGDTLNLARFRQLLNDRISNLDITKAKDDVRPFLRDASALDAWSPSFFTQIGARIAIQIGDT